MTQYVRALTREGLTHVNEDGRVQPRLASSWTWENNGLRLRVKLRDGVTFHDGERLDARTVANVLNAAIHQTPNRNLYPSLNDIVAVTAADDTTVVIDLSRPSAFLPEDLDLHIETGNPSQGTGPYRVVNRTKEQFELEAFEHYRDGPPTIDRVVMRAIPTLRAAWTSLLRSDLDMVTDVPPEAVEFIQNTDVQVIAVPRHYQYLIAFNSKRPPFTSPQVRRALNFAIDRTALLARVLRNRGTPSTGPLWPQYWAYDSAVAPYSYDPARAEALLDAAGFREGHEPATADAPAARLRFTCLIPDKFTLWEQIALEVQRNLYAVGVDMRFKVVPFQQFDSTIRDGAFDAVFLDMIGGLSPARAYTFWASQRAFQGLNVFGYESAATQRVFDVLRASTNEAAVRSATQRLQLAFADDPPALFIAWNERSRAIRREFRIPGDPRDPMLTLWRWAPASPLLTASAP